MAFYYSNITTYLESTSHLDVVRRVKKSGIIKERNWEDRSEINGADKGFYILIKKTRSLINVKQN